MPLSQTGSDIALQRNPATGKYTLVWGADGNPVFDDTQAHRVLSLLSAKRGKWWGDPNGVRGSLLYTIKNVFKRTTRDVETYSADALDKAVREGFITGVVVAGQVDGGRVKIVVRYQAPGARTLPLRFSMPL